MCKLKEGKSLCRQLPLVPWLLEPFLAAADTSLPPSPGCFSPLDTPVAIPLLPSSLPSGVLLQDGFPVEQDGVFLWAESSWQQRKEPAYFPKLISVSKVWT